MQTYHVVRDQIALKRPWVVVDSRGREVTRGTRGGGTAPRRFATQDAAQDAADDLKIRCPLWDDTLHAVDAEHDHETDLQGRVEKAERTILAEIAKAGSSSALFEIERGTREPVVKSDDPRHAAVTSLLAQGRVRVMETVSTTHQDGGRTVWYVSVVLWTAEEAQECIPGL